MGSVVQPAASQHQYISSPSPHQHSYHVILWPASSKQCNRDTAEYRTVKEFCCPSDGLRPPESCECLSWSQDTDTEWEREEERERALSNISTLHSKYRSLPSQLKWRWREAGFQKIFRFSTETNILAIFIQKNPWLCFKTNNYGLCQLSGLTTSHNPNTKVNIGSLSVSVFNLQLLSYKYSLPHTAHSTGRFSLTFLRAEPSLALWMYDYDIVSVLRDRTWVWVTATNTLGRSPRRERWWNTLLYCKIISHSLRKQWSSNQIKCQ